MSLATLRTLTVLALRTPSAALQVAAKGLRVLADVNQHIAGVLAGGSAAAPPAPHAARPEPASQTPARPPAASGPDDATGPTPAATADAAADVPSLAAQTAPRVIAALDGLSAEALAELHDYESRHRRRTTVLSAIEAAAAPPEQARDDLAIDDVREPDELVYTTSTPRR